MRSKARSGLLAGAAALLVAGQAAAQPSPAPCGSLDTPETGIQGDTAPSGGANCGLSLVAEVAGGGAVQGSGHCAYVRGGGVRVFDMSDPASPTLIRTLPLLFGGVTRTTPAETLRAVTTEERAVLIESPSVWDVSDCENPVYKGEIQWRGLLPWPAGLSHDIRISHDGRKVYAGLGAVVADISNLDDPTTWRVRNWSCDVARQAGHPLHQGEDLCDLADWEGHPTLSHGPDSSGDGSKWYVGNQTVSSGPELPTLRVLDITVEPPVLLGQTPIGVGSPGHGIDWFTTGGREYVLHQNEIVASPSSSCVPYAARTEELGTAHDALITEVTDPANPTRVSRVELAINKPENCAAKMASNQSTDHSYNSIDDPFDAHFAMVRAGNAGLRVFDIRNPAAPSEVAYFNRGALQHAGSSHYDASTGTIWVPGGSAFRVLEIQPQVLDALGLPHPPAPYPRYPDGRPATP